MYKINNPIYKINIKLSFNTLKMIIKAKEIKAKEIKAK
jgi:hypothetical protein